MKTLKCGHNEMGPLQGKYDPPSWLLCSLSLGIMTNSLIFERDLRGPLGQLLIKYPKIYMSLTAQTIPKRQPYATVDWL